jgi:murein DD-endopeptidase MepM/ murein hydrolase activator NlpD
MRKRNFTILVIPSGHGKTIKFTIDSFVLVSLAAFCVIFAASTLFFSYDYFSDFVDKDRMADLEHENRFLADKMSSMQSVVGELKENFANIVEKEKAIRVIFDLPDFDDQERMLGVGGPELFELSGSKGEVLAYQTESEIDELVRLSSFETEQFKGIYEKLLGRKDRLDHTPSIMPCIGYLTRGYGVMTHPITGYKCLHSGLDISNRTGTPIYATASGVVSFAGVSSGLGKTIEIDHGYGFITRFGHLSKFTARVGQKVARGEKIGEMGNTGYSTGTHLHYEVAFNHQTVDPKKYIIPFENEFQQLSAR